MGFLVGRFTSADIESANVVPRMQRTWCTTRMFIAETRTTISEKSELKIAAHLSDEMNRYKTLVSFCSDDMHDHAWRRADIMIKVNDLRRLLALLTQQRVTTDFWGYKRDKRHQEFKKKLLCLNVAFDKWCVVCNMPDSLVQFWNTDN